MEALSEIPCRHKSCPGPSCQATIQVLRRRGACRYCWIHPDEAESQRFRSGQADTADNWSNSKVWKVKMIFILIKDRYSLALLWTVPPGRPVHLSGSWLPRRSGISYCDAQYAFPNHSAGHWANAPNPFVAATPSGSVPPLPRRNRPEDLPTNMDVRRKSLWVRWTQLRVENSKQ